jgi:hypothetical protein
MTSDASARYQTPETTMTDPVSGAERRDNHQLRGIFVQAYDVIQPFFAPENSWGGRTHEHLAYRALHESFPSLSPHEIFVIVAAAKRVFSTTGQPVP